MDLRRVQETGGGTFLISLPKKWAERSGLKKGSLVATFTREDGCLILDPMYKLRRDIKTVVIKPSPHLVREITGKYLLGYDVIRVEAESRISFEDRESVKQAIQRLIGLEIVEEDAYKIILQCLLEPTAFPPDKILRREYLLSSGMHKDVTTALLERDQHLAKTIVERDEEVDRLYFLLVRLLRTIVLNPQLTEKLNVSLIDCLDYRLVASFIESIGDYSVKMAQTMIKFSDVSLPEGLLKVVSKISTAVYETHEKAMQAIFLRDMELAETVLKKYAIIASLIDETDKKLVNYPSKIISYVSDILFSFSKICAYSVDVADLVMPI